MTRVAFLLTLMGSAVAFPSPWEHPEQRQVVETYFDLPLANNSISDIRLWSVPRLDTNKDSDFWPFLLQLQEEDKEFFTSKENTQKILDNIFKQKEKVKDHHFKIFDASTAVVLLRSKQVGMIWDSKNDDQEAQRKKNYLKWCFEQKPAVKHLIRLPLAARIDPLAISNPHGVIQAYCRDEASCKTVADDLEKPGAVIKADTLDNQKFRFPKVPIPCVDCKSPEALYREEPQWCGVESNKRYRIGKCLQITAKERLTIKRGKNRLTFGFTGTRVEQETLLLYLASMSQLTYISTTPRNIPLLASSSRSVQGGGRHGACSMLRDHEINGRGYTIGLVDLGIDMHSSFFIDPDFPTPCSGKVINKQGTKDGKKYASPLKTCNNVKTNKRVIDSAKIVEVDNTEYRYQPKSRKVTSIVVQDGSDGTKGSPHGTKVAATINGFLSADTQYQNCPLSYANHRGIAYSSKISLYDVGAFSDGRFSINAPDEDYKKMFAVAHKLGAHEFVVPFGAQSDGRYTPIADDIDSFMADNRDALVVVAAGNGGSISSPAVSKNALAVGAVNQAFTGPASFTSEGPTHAGLIKPDVLAPGSNVELPIDDFNTVEAHCEMEHASGTSISAGFIGGAATLVREYFERGYYPSGTQTNSDKIQNVSAATIKAVLVNSARQRPLVQQDGFTCKTTDGAGHGSVQLENSLPFEDNRDYKMHMFQSIAHGATCKHGKCYGGKPGGDYKVDPTAAEDIVFEFDIEAKNPDVPISATLAWIDPPAIRGARNKVVQDIELEIEAPGGGIWKQQSFQQCNDVEHAFAPVENTQKVTVLAPRAKSVYTVRVRKKFVYESQEFSVVVTGGSIKKEDATSLTCCPEGSFKTWAGCFGVDYVVLTIICVIIGVVAIVALVLLYLNVKKKKQDALMKESQNDVE